MIRHITRLLAAAIVAAMACHGAGAATILPPGEQCFSANVATSGGPLGPISTLGAITAGGSGYVNGAYSNVPLTGGSGTGAQATISVSGNAVTGVTISNPGTHYAVADVLSASNAFLGGSGSGFQVPVGSTTGSGTGFVGLLGTITGGSGGTAGVYGGVALTGGNGSGATANITVSGGAVTAVAILNPGSRYVVGDVLSASPGSIGNVTGFSVPVASVAINSSLAGGSVGYFVPGTSTIKQTWQNAGQTILNQNPVPLDANGCAIIYGSGQYRQILKDSLGNTVWDQLTNDTSGSSVMWAGLASGTPNAITVTAPNFNASDGQTIQFIALNTNTGATTLNPSLFGVISIVKDTPSGPVPLQGGEIITGNMIGVTYDATNVEFHLTTGSQQTQSVTSTTVFPQGYLTLVSAVNGGPIQGASDVVAATQVFYSPYIGNQLPIWNGSIFIARQFPELTLNLTASAHVASTAYDVCVFSNAGNPVLVTGPAWANSTPGSSSRGTGAGTAQLARISGIWVNAVAITAVNGLNTFTVPADQCTYVGSILIDSVAGQISSYRTYGTNRKWGAWSTYNRVPISLLVGLPGSGSWNVTTTTGVRPSNNNAGCAATTIIGLPEEIVDTRFTQFVASTITAVTTSGTLTATGSIGVGWNSTTSISGLNGSWQMVVTNTIATGGPATIAWAPQGGTISADYTAPPSTAFGVNTATCLESATVSGTGSTFTWEGTNQFMQFAVNYRG